MPAVGSCLPHPVGSLPVVELDDLPVAGRCNSPHIREWGVPMIASTMLSSVAEYAILAQRIALGGRHDEGR
jgi:hypothetical protein